MAFQINTRTAIIAGVGVLALAGAGAWFFLFEEEAPPPRPAQVAATPGKPAVAAAKADDAAKAGAEAPKPPAAGARPAAAAKPAAKPLPTSPDQVIAEVIETSGMKTYFQTFGRDAMVNANVAGQLQQQGHSAADIRALIEVVERVFQPEKMSAELAANLKSEYDADKMTRFLELLRQPISLRMTAKETRQITPEALKEYSENFRKSPPSAARSKLIEGLDEISRTSDLGIEMASAMVNSLMDAVIESLRKQGKPVAREVKQMVGSQLQGMRGQMRSQVRTLMYIMYRDASDEELAEYVRVLDTEIGRWGLQAMFAGLRPIMESRARQFGQEIAQFALKQGTLKQASAAPAEDKAAPEKPAAPLPVAAAPAAAAPAGYQRPANIKELYTRYNDLVTAVVMKDRAAVNELLADGKPVNVRQSDGATPLMIAAGYGDLEIAGLLLAKGADPNLRAPGGASALSVAKAQGGAEMVRLLERHGARN